MGSANHDTRQTIRAHQSASTIRQIALLFTAFLLGIALCSAFFLWQAHRNNDPVWAVPNHHLHAPLSPHLLTRDGVSAETTPRIASSSQSLPESEASILDGLQVLVTIASYDFMQLSHLEEVLDGLLDICYAGSMIV